MFDWYTGFEDFITEGIAEACYWIGYKKTIKTLGLDDGPKSEGLDLIRTFVNERANLYRYRDELSELALDRAKGLNEGDQVAVVKAEARTKKIKEKALLAVFRILDHRQEFDDWMVMEDVDERPRGKDRDRDGAVEYDY